MAQSHGYWRAAGTRLWRDKLARGCIAILSFYFLLAMASAFGLVAQDWNREIGVSYANPGFLPGRANPQGENSFVRAEKIEIDAATRAIDPLAPYYQEIERRARQYAEAEPKPTWTLPFGGDRWGRDVIAKTVKGGQISITVGVAAALLAVTIGVLLGAVGGFFGGWIGDVMEWFYNIFTSVPYILLVLAFAAVFGRGVGTVILVLGLTGWTGAYRLIRSEYIKQRDLEYVQAADAIGASSSRRMFGHILPNVSHLILVQLSQLVVEFIKAEVILSFLGFGVPVNLVSWGIQINEVLTELVLGKWWQLTAVTVAMSVFVVAFGLFTDVLRDALDPRTSRK